MSTSRRDSPTLTTLPPHILTQILTYLNNDLDPDPDREPEPANYPPVDHSLNLQPCLRTALPAALLHVATASPILACAAARVTGAQHTYLTPQTTGYQLHRWVLALAPFVRAVSTDGIVVDWVQELAGQVRHSMYDNLLHEAMQLFNALSSHLVRLEVLDLVHVPFHTHHKDDALLTALSTALESNGATLRELALPAHPKSNLCARALELATLRRLDVFTVDLPDQSDARQSFVSCKPIFRMLQALDGHADRALGLTTVRDLRVINDWGAFRINARSGLSKSFFQSVRVLRLFNIPEPYSGFYQPQFHLFPHLDCLYWNYIPTSPYMVHVCKSLQEVHLCTSRWFSPPRLGNEEVEEDDGLRRLKIQYSLFMYARNLHTLMACSMLRSGDVTALSKSCPNLENLSLVLNPENADKLRGLLRRCGRMRVLELILDEGISGQLDDDAWHTTAKAVRGSESLSQFAILVRDEHPIVPTLINPVVNCCVSVVESLGSRARRLAFRVAVNSRQSVPIFYGVSRILDTCKAHTSALEFLQIDFLVPIHKLHDPDNVKRIWAQRDLTFAKEDLLRKIRSLRTIELGALNKVVAHAV